MHISLIYILKSKKQNYIDFLAIRNPSEVNASEGAFILVSTTQYTTVLGAESVSYTYNSNNILSSIITGSTTYTLNYDIFGNSSSVEIGNTTLASYGYKQKLKKSSPDSRNSRFRALFMKFESVG